jgi:hypothetical protein
MKDRGRAIKRPEWCVKPQAERYRGI